jgi:hypothetical protein
MLHLQASPLFNAGENIRVCFFCYRYGKAAAAMKTIVNTGFFQK